MANEKTKLVNNDDATSTPAKKTTFGALVYRLLIDDFLSKYMVMSSLNIASYLATNLVDRAGLLGLAPSRLVPKRKPSLALCLCGIPHEHRYSLLWLWSHI